MLCHPQRKNRLGDLELREKQPQNGTKNPREFKNKTNPPSTHVAAAAAGDAAARGARCSARKHLQRDIFGQQPNPSDPPLSPCRSRCQLRAPRTLRCIRSRHRPQSPGIGIATMALRAASHENPSQSSLPAAPALYRSCAVVLQRLVRLGGKKQPRNPPASARRPCPPPLSREPGAHR